MNEPRATYLGGVSKLDAALHLLHPQDTDLKVGEIMVFVEDTFETRSRPHLTNLVYYGMRSTPP